MIKMRLDTDALRALIKDNPEIEVEIGKAVMDNIKSDQLQGKVEAKIAEILKNMTENKGDWRTPNHVIKCLEMKAAIKVIVNELVGVQIKETVDNLLDARVTQLLTRETERLRDDLREAMFELLTPEMAKELMREKLF